VLVYLKHLPPESALVRAVSPDEAEWTLVPHLLAGIADRLEVANWQRAGDKNAPKPKPIPRPGVEGKKRRSGTPQSREEVWQALRGTPPPAIEVTDG